MIIPTIIPMTIKRYLYYILYIMSKYYIVIERLKKKREFKGEILNFYFSFSFSFIGLIHYSKLEIFFGYYFVSMANLFSEKEK